MKKIIFIILLFVANGGHLFAQSMDSTERDSLYQVIEDLSNRVKLIEHQLKYNDVIRDLNKQLQDFKIFDLDLTMLSSDILVDLRNNTIKKRYDKHKQNFDVNKKLFSALLIMYCNTASLDGFTPEEKDNIDYLNKEIEVQIESITNQLILMEKGFDDLEKLL